MATPPKNPFGVQLDAEEQEILREVEAGEWQEIPHVEEEKQRIQALVRQASAKTKRVTFRLTAGDLHALQMKAREEGIPYQTLIASILHKYVTGRLVAR
jgi:predicted DNA binding CopG/RHH family protein